MEDAQFRRADGSYAAFMCKRCGYGPVDHGNCDDLRAHHHEARWHGWKRTRVSNGQTWAWRFCRSTVAATRAATSTQRTALVAP